MQHNLRLEFAAIIALSATIGSTKYPYVWGGGTPQPGLIALISELCFQKCCRHLITTLVR